MLDISKIGQAAAEAEDLSVDKKFDRELPKEGTAFLRLTGYVETGRHESNNPQHKPALRCLFFFELSHPKHSIDLGDGKKIPQTLIVRSNKGMTAKSGYKKMFKMMDSACGGGHTHFVQMIGKPMLGTIYHNKSEDGKNTYVNLDRDGAWSFQRPVMVDPIAETETPVPIPEMQTENRVFLWENEGMTDEQIKQMWDTIYIEGTREVEDKDTKEKVEKSKNWIQETIMNNMEWEGSRTQGIVIEHIDLDEEPKTEPNQAAADALAKKATEQPTGPADAPEQAAVPSLDD